MLCSSDCRVILPPHLTRASATSCGAVAKIPPTSDSPADLACICGGPPKWAALMSIAVVLAEGHFGGGGTRHVWVMLPSVIWKSPLPVMCTYTAPA